MDLKEAIGIIRTAISKADILDKKIEISEANMNLSFRDAAIDSLNAMCIIVEVEKIINKRFPDEVLTSLLTIGDLANAIVKFS